MTAQRLLSVAYDLRRRAEALNEWASGAASKSDRAVMIGDAGVMEYAASVIESCADGTPSEDTE